MLGLGRNPLGGGASVRVTLLNQNGQRYKVGMTLSQMRRRLVDRVALTEQDWMYRTGVPLAGASLAAAAPLLHRLWMAWEEGGQTRAAPGVSSHVPLGSARLWLGLLPFLLVQEAEDALHAGRQYSPAREEGTSCCDEIKGACPWALGAVRLVSFLAVYLLAWSIFRQVLSATELVFKKRYKYSKLFSMLTSFSKASRYAIPHFTLKNPLNIKMWLALRGGRAWLRRFEAQRVADTVVSSTFRTVAFFLAVLCVEVFLCKDVRPFLTELWHWELVIWGGISSIFLLRFFSLGTRTNEKFGDTTILLTEQLNVQLRIFENCSRSNDRAKLGKLQISSNVLKLAVKLLRELDSPNRVSGLSMSPTLVRVTRVILLSALSALVSDVFGFKLKVNQLLK